jgi:transposase-like protein
VSKRVSPTARLRGDIDELFSSDRELSSILEDVARLSVRLMMQVAVEAEVDEFLGRARYQRRDDEDRAGSRNGWQPPAAVKTTMGPVELQRPKLRGTDEAFCSRLFGAGVTRTNALESLVISGWGARPVRPRHRGRLGRGARPGGSAVEVDRQPDLPAHPH